MALLLAAGFVAGCGGDDGGSSYRQPKGPAQATLRIEAGNFFFKPETVTGPAGIDKVELVGKGGTHTLVIDGVKDFELQVDGGARRGEGSLRAGQLHLLLQHPGPPRRRHGGHVPHHVKAVVTSSRAAPSAGARRLRTRCAPGAGRRVRRSRTRPARGPSRPSPPRRPGRGTSRPRDREVRAAEHLREVDEEAPGAHGADHADVEQPVVERSRSA